LGGEEILSAVCPKIACNGAINFKNPFPHKSDCFMIESCQRPIESRQF